jgi:hypothetical protein
LYLRGLMLDDKRNSMQPMAARLGVDHQELQQFVTSSTWNYGEVRRPGRPVGGEFVAPEAYVVGGPDGCYAADGGNWGARFVARQLRDRLAPPLATATRLPA